MRVYIAGPYTGGDTIINVRRAIEAGNRVAEAGHTVFIPHLYHFWHFLCPQPYRFWMDQGLGWLPVCDVLLRLTGDSPGGDREVELATKLGIPIFEDFGTEFWHHLKTGGRSTSHVDAVFTHHEPAIDCLKTHPGATMIYRDNDDGVEFVVGWREPCPC